MSFQYVHNIIHDTYFFTATCCSWKNLLQEKQAKEIIIDILNKYNRDYNIHFYGFVIMPNHLHLVLSGTEERLIYFKRSFTRISAHNLLKYIKGNSKLLLTLPTATQNDRKYQNWERRPHWKPIYNEKSMSNILNYIHDNPLQSQWKIAEKPHEYEYSSSNSYMAGQSRFGFLSLWNRD